MPPLKGSAAFPSLAYLRSYGLGKDGKGLAHIYIIFLILVYKNYFTIEPKPRLALFYAYRRLRPRSIFVLNPNMPLLSYPMLVL